MAKGSVSLTVEEASQIATQLCDQIDESTNAKEQVKDRWDMVDAIFRCDNKSSNLHIVDGLDPYVFPMYRQKATKIGRTILGAYYNLSPWVQMVDVGKTVPDSIPIETDKIERTMQAWQESSNQKSVMSPVLMNAVHYNCGIAQVCTKPDGTLFFRNVHPSKSVLYPCQTSDYNQLMTMGHQFHKLRYQLEEGLEDGTYNKDWFDLSRVGEDQNRRTTNDQVEAKDFPVLQSRADESIECYELITRLKLDGDERRELYKCCVEKESVQLMCIERYQYSRPWYFVFKTNYDEDNMYPSDSIGGVMQGLQLAYNDLWTTVLHGSYMAAFPLIIISGGSLGNKVSSYQPAQCVETGDDVKLQTLATQFNPGALPMVGQKFEDLADAVSGVSRIGDLQPMPSHTTATAASGFLAAQQESKDEYVEGVESTFREMYEFIFEMLDVHGRVVMKKMGAKWQIDAPIERSSISLEPTGGGTTTDPQLLGQKLRAIYEMALAPNSIFDLAKVEKMIAEAMDFPADTDSLMKTEPTPLPPPPPVVPITLSISGNLNEQPPEVIHEILKMAGLPTGEMDGEGDMGEVLQGEPGMGGIEEVLAQLSGGQAFPPG